MTAKQKMIAIVGKAIVDTLEEYANKQPNLASETSRFKIMTDIMDKIVKVIDDPEFKG
jgi:23S rRNA G2445 N2-methylase RlmL